MDLLPELEKLRAKDPKKIGPYKLVGRIGSGGMGVVFLGTLGTEQVAVKTVRSSFLDDPGLKSRFTREIDNLKKMNSPRIAKYLDSSISGEVAWHAVEYIDGPNLRDLVKSQGPLPEDQWWSLAAQLVDALQYLDKLGIVHRDIKPSNIIMSEDGISLVDFGISQDTDSTSITTTGMVSGSPAWLAPEQLEGSAIGSASDWFSTGSVLVFAAKGTSPWGNETSMTIPVLHQKILTGSPDLEGLTQQQKDLLESLLDPNPKNRKLPKSFPNYSGATITSFPTKKTPTTGKKTSKRLGATSSKVMDPSSIKFTVALVVVFFFGGALGLSQVSVFFPELSASEPNATPQVSQGLSNRDFAPGEACGELEIVAEKMIASMNDATTRAYFNGNWGQVRPSADDAVQEYQLSLLKIQQGQLPRQFVNENLGYLQALSSKFETISVDSHTYVTGEPEYIVWRSHIEDVFKPGNWCG